MGEMAGKLLAARRNSSRYNGGMLLGGQGKNGFQKAYLSVLLVMSTSVFLCLYSKSRETSKNLFKK